MGGGCGGGHGGGCGGGAEEEKRVDVKRVVETRVEIAGGEDYGDALERAMKRLKNSVSVEKTSGSGEATL